MQSRGWSVTGVVHELVFVACGVGVRFQFQCRGGYAKCAEVRDAKRSARRDGDGSGDLRPPLTRSNR